MRFTNVGRTFDNTEFDLVVKALDTVDAYHSFSPDVNNLAIGRGFQINLGVTKKDGKLATSTEFEFSFEDREGKPVKVDAVDFYLLDLDRDFRRSLRETGCYNL